MTLTRDARAARGDAATREFYDQKGWHEAGDRAVDTMMFGVPLEADGPLRQARHRERQADLTGFLSGAARRDGAGVELRLLEVGCGGNPDLAMADVATHYTGADFSAVGLARASRQLRTLADRRAANGHPFEFDVTQADACNLPFPDGHFDAVFCAHMIYHISDPAAQAAALTQLVRVVRPGGRVVVIGANPRPLLWPLRAVRRTVADTPLLGAWVQRVRRKPPLPFNPRPLGWMKRQLRDAVAAVGANPAEAGIECRVHDMASTATKQRLREGSALGRPVWRAIHAIEERFPRTAARLGNYVQYRLARPA